MSKLKIPLSELQFSAIRAQGAGGQNVNKVSTAIHLRFHIGNSSLSEAHKEKLQRCTDRRISKEGVVIIKAQRYRSQEKNRFEAIERLHELVTKAVKTDRVRKATRPTRSSVSKRLTGKKQKGKTKNLRGKPGSDD